MNVTVIGVAGGTGSGKSTLMKLLVAGLLPSSGTISVDGTPLPACEKALKARLGYLPQSFGLYEELTVWQFLDYMAALKGIRDSRAAIDRAMEAANLVEKRKARIRTLSGGQRQRVGIARALAANPNILLMDEPFGAVDEITRKMLQAEITRIHRELGVTIVFITHDIREALTLGTRIIVMKDGHIEQDGTPEEICKHPETEFVKQLIMD